MLRPELAVDGAERVGVLLDEVAGPPWLPSSVRQRARAWARAVLLQGPAAGPGGAAADLDVKAFGG